MKYAKRFLAICLSVAMLLSAVPSAAAAEAFQLVKTYVAGQFTDLGTDQWYEASVQKAYELGLMSGDPNGEFRPAGQVTLAETVTVAARIHALATTGAEAFVQGEPWYQVYADYALQNGILTEPPADYTKAATRLEFARILAKALPVDDLPAINVVEYGMIPDVADEESVYLLYRAGVLTGSDARGTFLPDSTIQRSEVAAIVSRMALPELRQTVLLGETTGLLGPVVSEDEDEDEDDEEDRSSNRDKDRYEDWYEDRYEDWIADEEVSAEVPAAPDFMDENNALTKPFDQVYPDLFASGTLEYSGEYILIKLEEAPSGRLSGELYDAGVTRLEELYSLAESVWYKAEINGDVQQVMSAVREIDDVLVAEYDFVYAVEGYADVDTVSDAVSGNKHAHKQWHLRHHGIHKIWEGDQEKELSANHGEGIVVAVIDTGVDYTHEDLKDNIWVNVDETPDNGIDDDGNGYIDDYYGVNVVVNNGATSKPYSAGDPMDDHGHGTHVAGVIAGVNNNLGVVGVAYGAKIMVIKAGQSSGYFNNSDIAEAIIYAYENGADVINMSFGGSTVAMAVTDALEAAYTNCVLVASAGNNGAPNEGLLRIPNYPAALKYVLGVMSVDENGVESSFSNWDVALYSTVEYEVYAPGENIMSTIPGNRYASWDGTSMAAPIVSAMAAMVRNAYPDRNTYPTKFIYGQIVNSGDEHAICVDPNHHGFHNLPQIANIYNAITTIPTPDVGVVDYRIFDSKDLDPDNNGDGVIDAGETVALGFTVRNRWGMAENTLVTVDSLSTSGIPCPYVTITDYDGEQNADEVSATINYGSVGTYSDSDCGKKMDGDVFVGWEEPFLLEIDEDCPNDYIIKLNIVVQAENGLDETDKTIYSNGTSMTVDIRRGVPLAGRIEEDTTLTADNYYIIYNTLQIAEGVTVRVEPGTQIQFWTDDPHDSYADRYMACLDVRGTLLLEGTEEEPIEIFPSELMSQYEVKIYEQDDGVVKMWHTNIVNPYLCQGGGNGITYAENCEFTQNYRSVQLYTRSLSGGKVNNGSHAARIHAGTMKDCAFYRYGGRYSLGYYSHTSTPASISGYYENCIFVDCDLNFSECFSPYYNYGFDSCVFYGNNTYLGETTGDTSMMSVTSIGAVTELTDVDTDPATGKTYLRLACRSAARNGALERFAKALGGTLACINSQEELAFLQENGLEYSTIGLRKDLATGELYWVDGTDVDPELITDFRMLESSRYGYYYYSSSIVSPSDHILIELPAQYVTDIELDCYEVTIDSESPWMIQAETIPAEAAETLLIYESEGAEIADVSESGVVTGKSAGDTIIRVYSPDRKIWRELTVHVIDRAPLEAIDLGENFAMNEGEERQLAPVLSPAATSERLISYESSDEDVLTVDQHGKVTAVAEGTAVVTVTSVYNPAIYDEVEVRVIIPAQSVVAADTMQMFSLDGETTEKDLGITVYPRDASDKTLIWESSNPEIAYVQDGVLVKQGLGVTTLRATVTGTDLYVDVVVCISEIQPEVHVVQLQNNNNCFMALLSDGTLWWWGGQTPVPVQLKEFSNVKQFAYNWEQYSGYLLVLTKDGVLNRYLFSRNSSTAMPNRIELNNYTFSDDNQPVTDVKAVACGRTSPYAWYYLKEDGSVWGWGGNSYGQLGTGTTTNVDGDPVQMDLAGKKITAIVTDNYNVYVLDTENTVWTFGGYNEMYTTATEYATDVLGLSTDAYRISVILEKEDTISYDRTFTKQGVWNTVSRLTHAWIDEDGTVYMGTGSSDANRYGQLGVGDTTVDYNNYRQVLEVENAEAVFMSNENSFFQTEDGKFYSVGRNDANQMGNLTVGHSSVPKRVLFGLNGSLEAPVKYQSGFIDGMFTLEFDQAVLRSNQYHYITLTDSEGATVSLNQKLLYLDKLSVLPMDGWVVGEEYTLTIPADAVKNMFALANAEEIEVTFNVSESDAGSNGEDDMGEGSLPEFVKPVTDGGLKVDESILREEWTEERVMDAWEEFEEAGYNTNFWNNAILNRTVDDKVTNWLRLEAPSASNYYEIGLGGNYWGSTASRLLYEQLLDFDHFQTLAKLNEGEYLEKAPVDVWPIVTEAGLIDSAGEEVDVIGNETVTFYVEFNRNMDKSVPLDVRFGSYYPYADYQVDGEWVSKRRWEGTTTLTTIIENGYQFWTIMNGQSAPDEDGEHLKLYEDWGRFSFKIDTTSAQAMILQGDATDTGINLTWYQDDFDTLMGYNIYRADKDEDAYYQRLNSSIIPVGEEEFFDSTVLPGQIYYYKFTVVQTDLSESAASGKIRILSKDTMAPGIYHTPVYHAYEGSNLVISAVVTDNLAEHPTVKLYYRVTGADGWKEAEMTALNDKYSAVIGFNDVTVAGIEYYLSAFDGVNTTYSGDAESPYQITIQEPLDKSDLGDVNGDGYITLLDALMVIQCKNGIYSLEKDAFDRGDLDGDGILSSAEALTILKYANGQIGSLKP